MKSIIKKIIKLLQIPFIIPDYIKFKKTKNKRFELSLKNTYPCIKDKTIKTSFDAHYVYHTSWAARKVKEINPERHADISSSLYFSGIVSAFLPIDFYDYRPAELTLSNLNSAHADLTDLLFSDDSLDSLSCMHTIEHIGLGRYGDKIDYDGDIKAIKELQRVVKPNGSLLFVVPVGRAKIEFNAHRIYTFEQILDHFENWELREFSLITDKQKFINNANPDLVKNQDYACGCFWFIKK